MATWTQCGLTSKSGGWTMSFVRAAQHTLCRTRRHVGPATRNRTQPHQLSGSRAQLAAGIKNDRTWSCHQHRVVQCICRNFPFICRSRARCACHRARPDASFFIHFFSLLLSVEVTKGVPIPKNIRTVTNRVNFTAVHQPSTTIDSHTGLVSPAPNRRHLSCSL